MATVNLSEDNRELGALVDRVVSGETVEIAKGGRIVAKVVPVETRRWSIDFDALDRLRASGPMTTMTVEEMRRLDLL